MRKSILILSSFLLLAGCVGEENLDYDKTWNEDFDYTVDEGTDIEVPGTDELTDTIDLRIFDAINLDYPGLEKVKEAYEAGKLYAETHPDEEGEGSAEGDGTGEGASEGEAAAESKASDEVSDEGPGDKDGYYKAAAYLLEYFRNRTNVSYPQIEASLINATYTANQKTIADKALEGHFYVRNFTLPLCSSTYEDFADFGMTTDKETGEVTINWGMAMPSEFTAGSVQEWDSQQHRHQWMIEEAKVYRATGDKAYIENWKTVYRNWVDNSPVPEGAETGHTVTSSDLRWYGLQPTERLFEQCSIFYYFLDAEEFTPGWLTFFLSEFAKTANIIKSNPFGPADEAHNITLSQNQTLYFAGVLFPEFKNASDWENFSAANIETINKKQFFSDGGPVEYDPSYHMGNVANFYDISVLANANDRTLPSDFINNLEGGCEFMVDITYPSYNVDNFNDTRSDRMSKSVLKRNFGEYLEMFPDNNKFRYMATDRKDGSEPDELVSVYPETGYYMLRTGWNEDDAMIVVKNNPDPNNQWHCQADNLTFSIYSNGVKFSPDAGSYSYDNGGNRNKYAASGMHNVMGKPSGTSISSVVQFDDKTRTGEFLGSGSGRNYEWVAAQNANYSDLTHRRAVFMVNDEFFVLVDEGFGSYAGDVKLLFKGGNPDGKKRDNFVLLNCKQSGNGEFDPTQPVTMYTNLSGTSNMMFVTFPATTDGYDSNWTTGYFSNEMAEETQRRNYEVCQNKPGTDAVRFITVLYPFGSASEFENIKISAEFADNGFSDSGASVKVTVNKAGNTQNYNLSYTINQ